MREKHKRSTPGMYFDNKEHVELDIIKNMQRPTAQFLSLVKLTQQAPAFRALMQNICEN